jgi:hypothetical protein
VFFLASKDINDWFSFQSQEDKRGELLGKLKIELLGSVIAFSWWSWGFLYSGRNSNVVEFASSFAFSD